MDPQNTNPAPSTNNNIFAVFAYLGILIIIPLLTETRNNPFVKFHIKQGIVLIISWAVACIVNIIPILGQILSFILCIFSTVLVIIGIVNVVSNKEKELPLIGKFGSKFNI